VHALSRRATRASFGIARRHATVGAATLAPAPATGALGLDLLRRLGGGNLVFSPDSIAGALAMAATGAAGRTATQMASVLHVASPAVFTAVGRLQRTIAAEQIAAGHGGGSARGETEVLPYGHGHGYAAVELPYSASTLSLLVVLPVGQSVSSLQHGLNADELARIAGTLAPKCERAGHVGCCRDHGHTRTNRSARNAAAERPL
jgi:Serpin (serine protease inhibitor)